MADTAHLDRYIVNKSALNLGFKKVEYYIVETHCDKVKRIIDNVNKIQQKRQRKIENLRISEDPNNISLDEKVDDLEMQFEIQRMKLIKMKEESTKKDPKLTMKLENDILMTNIRYLRYHNFVLENQVELVKEAHKKIIGKLDNRHKVNIDGVEVNRLVEQLRNTKYDLIQAKLLIDEMLKVAIAMLPKRVAQYIEKVNETYKNLKNYQEELVIARFNLYCKNNCLQEQVESLKLAIESENTLNDIYKVKIEKLKSQRDPLIKKLAKMSQIIAKGHEKLAKKGYNLNQALNLTKESYSEDISINRKLQRRRSMIEFKEKIDFLEEKKKSIDSEMEIAKAEYEKIKESQSQISEEVMRIKLLKEDIKKLKERKAVLLIELQQETLLRKTYFNQIEDLKGKIRVYCRVRPISKEETKRGNEMCVKIPDVYTVTVQGVSKDRRIKEFQFDRVFGMDSTQDEVFIDTSKLIQSAFDGFNVCIFAYGQTGSGKTFTLIGNLDNNPGIAPRTFQRIFDIAKEGEVKFKTEIKCYMLELYNEKLLDLMTSGADYSDKLEIKKDVHGMVIVPGANLAVAKSFTDLRDLFLKGNSNRHIASTKMNSESSRSHLILSMMMVCTMTSSNKSVRGKISIIDLAGSERMAKSGVTGVGAQEATSINQSLSALGDVISALTSGQPFVPYRNNKLTLLMQDSLGGNAKTLMFVNISPVDYNAVETASSLTYAARVKLIKNEALKVPDSEEVPKLQKIIDDLLSGRDVEL